MKRKDENTKNRVDKENIIMIMDKGDRKKIDHKVSLIERAVH